MPLGRPFKIRDALWEAVDATGFVATVLNVDSMSNLRGHKSRLTSAVGTLSKTISSVDLTYLTSLDTSTAPEIQLREIIRRRATITGKKFAIQRALEVVKERYNALMLFVQSREDSSSLSEEIDQFWSQLYGEKFEQDATETILALDTQLTIDEALETSLRSQITENITHAAATLAISDSPGRLNSSSDPPSESNRENPHQPSFNYSTPHQSIPLVNKLEHRSGKIWTLPELLDGFNEVIEELEQLEDHQVGKSTVQEFSVNSITRSRSRSPSYKDHRYRSPNYRSEGSTSPTQHRSRGVKTHSVRFTTLERRKDSPHPSKTSAPREQGTSVHYVSGSEREYESSDHQDDMTQNIQLVAAINTPKSCTLMTVQASILNPKTRKQRPVVILLDTGAQTSFISKAAVEEHQLDVFEQDLLTTYSFGAVSTTEHSGKSYITLIDRHNQPISLVLHTKDRLTIPSPPTRLTEEDREILRSLNVSLHSLTADRSFFVELMQHKPVVINSISIQSDTDPISRFDSLDIIGITDNPDPLYDQHEDAKVLQRFQETAQVINGHLYVQFPWKSSHPRLANNKSLALKRLESQYRTLSAKSALWQLYSRTVQDYLQKTETYEKKTEEKTIVQITTDAIHSASTPPNNGIRDRRTRGCRASSHNE
ncbi:hypothetical protein OSTOST_09978 [Ostertagia ostertagi]